jgi:hypothetical protein
MEFAKKSPGDFTKSGVEDYAKTNYPGFLDKASPRATATALVKLTLKGKLERVYVGQNGSESVYRKRS